MLVLVPTVFEAVHLFGEAVRAPLEADGVARFHPGDIEAQVAPGHAHAAWHVATCGFGLAASGIGALAAMLAHGGKVGGGTLRRAVLAGIAGTFDSDRAPVGTAVLGSVATCDGIGAGSGDAFVPASAMGWSQGHARSWLPAAGDRVSLAVPAELAHMKAVPILSVGAASGDADHAAERARRHPDAVLEEMEAFAVALAARLCRVELVVIRGVSDLVGDRDHAAWQVGPALRAVRASLDHLGSVPRWGEQ